MSLDLFVERGAGDRRGEDIIEPLLGGSVPAALARGRNELDNQASSPQSVSVECVFRTGMRVGQHVRFYDFDSGEAWDGKITSLTVHQSVSTTGVPELIASMQVERPTDFFV